MQQSIGCLYKTILLHSVIIAVVYSLDLTQCF